MKRLIFLLALLCLVTSFKKKELEWGAIGDSITWLNEHPGETGSRITTGYMSIVTKQLPHIHYINQGHNGWTSGEIADQVEKLGLVKADVYSIFLGTNDWWHGRTLGALSDYTGNKGNETVYGSFRIIMNKLHSLNPDAKIILITPMQRVDFVYVNGMSNNAYGSYKQKNGQWLEQFANAVNAIGKYVHIPVVDLFHTKGMGLKDLVKFKRLRDPRTGEYKNYRYPNFIGVPLNIESDEYPYPAEAADVTYDGLHPSDKGFKIIAGKLVKIMKKF
ncbi:MAG: SGNH/GDSL hydrolase family protein [Chitinophagaceae bacterium]|nr:SGNH/GDSL hydrolase family protein [Chitinophagaceae bacterium]